MRKYLTSSDLVREFPVTARQVQFWSEQGLLRPSLARDAHDSPGCFPARKFNRAEMLKFLFALEMKKRGFQPEFIGKVLPQVNLSDTRLVGIALTRKPRNVFVLYNFTVYRERSPLAMMNRILAGKMAVFVVIDIAEIHLAADRALLHESATAV